MVNCHFAGVVLALRRLVPRRHFPVDGIEVSQAPVQALADQGTELTLGHVEPTAVFGRIHEFKLAQQLPGLDRGKRLVQ